MTSLENEYKEVYFHEYCPRCEYKDRKNEQKPCCYCMDETRRLHSHKPVNFEENDKK